MEWWLILILIVIAIFGLAVLFCIPYGYAMGAAFGSIAKRPTGQEPAEQPNT